jgi:zinc transport system permease protein
MFNALAELFAMPFFSRALIALLCSGAAFPVLGIFILNLELIPARFAVMHAALLGASAALLTGTDPLWTAMLVSVLAGAAIAVISWRGKISAGGSLGLIMTVSLGLSFIIFYKANVHAIEAFNLFWGNILALSVSDTILAVVMSALIFLFLALCYKEIHAVLYDRELARAAGIPSRFIYSLIMLAVCLGIGCAMRITGALLVDAVTILPALAARQIGRGFKALIVWGALTGIFINMTGFAFSFLLDLPVSPAIIIMGALVVLVLRIISLKQRSFGRKLTITEQGETK